MNDETPSPEPISTTIPRNPTPNYVLQQQALSILRGNWGPAVGLSAIFIVFGLIGLIPTLGFFISILLSAPLTLGGVTFYLTFVRTGQANVGLVLDGFNRYGTAFLIALFTGIFTFLWTLLLIVPGIIAAISYSMSYYIAHDNPSLGALDAIRASKKMMAGHKMRFFCLGWRFFGWAILCVLSLGIGFLWLQPYMNTTFAKFYEDIKELNPA